MEARTESFSTMPVGTCIDAGRVIGSWVFVYDGYGWTAFVSPTGNTILLEQPAGVDATVRNTRQPGPRPGHNRRRDGASGHGDVTPAAHWKRTKSVGSWLAAVALHRRSALLLRDPQTKRVGNW